MNEQVFFIARMLFTIIGALIYDTDPQVDVHFTEND